jgi:hypothetical protein
VDTIVWNGYVDVMPDDASVGGMLLTRPYVERRTLQSTHPVLGPFGQFGAEQTPLNRWVMWPELLNHSLGRSRVATVTVSPLVSATWVP